MELSFFELIMVGVIAFLVLGPTEMVRLSRKLGQWVAKLKTEARNFKIMAEEQLLNAETEVQRFTEVPNLTEPQKLAENNNLSEVQKLGELHKFNEVQKLQDETKNGLH